MNTLGDRLTKEVSATGVRFDDNVLHISFSDGREVSVPLDKIKWLEWLARATHPIL